MRKNLYLLIIMIVLSLPVYAQDDTYDTERQYTSWSIIAGPTLSGYRFNPEQADNAPDQISAGIGGDIGTAISYHIAPHWQLRMTAQGYLERCTMIYDDQQSVLSSEGIDLILQAAYSFDINGKNLLVFLGPYTHFILASNSSNHLISNPFKQSVSINPRTGKPLFAMGDTGAGAAMTLMMQFDKKWHIALDIRLGISDMFNSESHNTFIKPYKFALQIGRDL